ncbi:hypothetical protein Tco_1089291, partial [Tanacetum coccineum]
FTMEDLEDLYKLVKAKNESTRPVEDLDLVLWNDLKTIALLEFAIWNDLHAGRKEISPYTTYNYRYAEQEASVTIASTKLLLLEEVTIASVKLLLLMHISAAQRLRRKIANPNYATYPEDGVVAGSYEVSREEWNGPYQLTLSILTKEVFKDPRVCKMVVDQFPIPREMVRIEALTDDRLAGKMSVLHYMMMSHRGELLARYRGLLKSHHKYVPSTYSRLKGFQQRLTSFQGLKSQVFGLKKQVTDLNDKITASDAAFVKAKAKGKPGGLMLKKDIRLPPLKVTLVLVQKLLASDEFSRVQGDLLSLASSAGFERRLTVVPAPRVAGVSPPFTKELIVTHAPSLVELFSKDATPSYTTTSEQNKEWLSVMGVAHPVCKDVNRVESSSIQELGFASSGSADVLIALSVGEKEHGSPHSSDVLVTASADAGDAVAALFGV